MKSSEKLAQKIEALRAEMSEAKAAEKAAALAEAERAISVAVARSGLLAAVRAGKVTSDQLAAEFEAVVERAEAAPKPAAQVVETAAVESVEPSEPEPTDGIKKHLWGRS